MLQILAATGNKHKVEEFKSMLAGLAGKVSVCTPDSIEGFPEIVEDGRTFEENAEKKARQASAYADMSAFADDSGLEVEALGGEPGVLSARYAGEGAANELRIAKLLKNMEGKENRRARFVCVISIAYRGEVVGTFRGEVKGRIIDAPRGSHGFGYDPVFVPDGYEQTFGELGPDVKDRISHRADAMRQAVDFIMTEFASMDDFEFV